MNRIQVVAICSSEKRRTRKQRIDEGRFREDWGLEGDAHAGPWHRQVSFLAEESIERARAEWHLDVSYGDFAENITTRGLDLFSLPVGARLEIGESAVFEITQKGKRCHTGCEIMQQSGRCVFPTEGIFGKVLRSGTIRAGDPVTIRVGSGAPGESDCSAG